VSRDASTIHNYFRNFDATLGTFRQSDPIGLRGGIKTYGYVGGNPVSNYDPSGLYCSSANGTTSCSYPGGPAFQVPTPPGWVDFNASYRQLYHKYSVQRDLGCADSADVMQQIINSPTPGSPSPASPGGTPNNAPVPGFGPNSVTSYLTIDTNTGLPLVVNMTGPNSAFGPAGYVARGVANGVAFTDGEGLSPWQSPSLTGEWIQNIANQLLWGRQLGGFIKNAKSTCGCPH